MFANDSFPFSLGDPFSVDSFDRVKAGEGFDQCGVLLGTHTETFLDDALQWALQCQRNQNDDRNGGNRYQNNRTADPENDQQEKNGKRQIDQGRDCRGSDEVPEHLEFLQIVGQAAHRTWPDGGFQSHDLFEYR